MSMKRQEICCRVLYISTHRYEHGQYWPNLAESDFDHIGEGDGKGYNVNIPLNKVRDILLNNNKII